MAASTSPAEQTQLLIARLANEVQKQLRQMPSGTAHLDAIARAKPRIEQAYATYDQRLDEVRKTRVAHAESLLADPQRTADSCLDAARTLFEYGDLIAARAAIAHAQRIDAHSRSALLLLGRLFLVEGNAEQALVVCAPVVASPPDTPLACRSLGQILRAGGRIDEAIAMFLRAVGLSQGDDRAAQIELGLCLLVQGRRDEAVETFRHHTRQVSFDENVLVCHLAHEIEQTEYLIAKQLVSADSAEYVRLLREVVEQLSPAGRTLGHVAIDTADRTRIEKSFGAITHIAACPPLPGDALNPRLDFARIEADYANAAPGMVAVDNFLQPEALASLRSYCLESTVWKSAFPGGYVGAMPEDGFAPPLLFQIADELKLRLHGLLKDHVLLRFWAFKYDQSLLGISTHADPAVINVNFWLTPDSANRDATSGGLVVWDKIAPQNWPHADYNRNVAKIHRFLDEPGAQATKFAYKENRAVIFNSELFHETDSLDFEPGYENRRINITLLFGESKGLRHFL